MTPGGPVSDGPAVVRRPPRRRSYRRRRRVGLAALVLGAAMVAGAVLLEPSVVVAAGGAPPSRATTPVLSARRDPGALLRPVGRRRAAERAADAVAAAPSDSCLLVRDGDVDLVAVAPDVQLSPASNMKVLTAAVALDVLGPTTTFRTTVAGAPPRQGAVAGDLYLVGGGDPLLTTDTGESRFSDGPQPVTDMEALADKVVAAGVRRVEGSVVGDGSRDLDVRSLASWPARFTGNGTVAPLAGLLVNDGWTVSATPPATGGGPAPDPPAHAAGVLTELLRARGVEVVGPPRSGTRPEGLADLVVQPSLEVRALVDEMLRFSDNTTAEVLLREVARASGAGATTAAGAAAATEWLAAEGYPAEGVVVLDGSGLSAGNRLTCRLIAELLARDGPTGPVASGLARPAEPGTMVDRLLPERYRGKVRAKTGTLNGVTALSGWVRTGPGRDLVFAVVANPRGRAVTAADLAVAPRLIDAVLTYPETPPAATVSPRPPA